MERFQTAICLMQWAMEHPREWAVINGEEQAGLMELLAITEKLEKAEFNELALMMTLKVIKMRLTEEAGGE